MKQYDLSVSYSSQWWAAVVVALVLVAIGGIQALGPEALGIEPITLRWLGIVALCLGAAQAFLPKVQAPPIKNYDEVKRVEALTAEPPEGQTYPPEFVDAVAEALLRKRAEDLEQRYPRATLAPPTPDPYRSRPEWIDDPKARTVPHG